MLVCCYSNFASVQSGWQLYSFARRILPLFYFVRDKCACFVFVCYGKWECLRTVHRSIFHEKYRRESFPCVHSAEWRCLVILCLVHSFWLQFAQTIIYCRRRDLWLLMCSRKITILNIWSPIKILLKITDLRSNAIIIKLTHKLAYLLRIKAIKSVAINLSPNNNIEVYIS